MKAKQFYYVMIASIVISFGAIIGAFYWGDMQLKNEASVVAKLQADRDVLREKVLTLKKTQETATSIEDAQKLLDKLLPTTKQQETLIADVIYTATAEAGIPIQSINSISFAGGGEPDALSGTEQSKEITGVYTYPFTVSVQEITYETLLVLLKEIETNGRLVQIDDLQINPSKSEPGLLSSVNLSLKAFLKP